MGIKSTIDLTRQAAEDRFVELRKQDADRIFRAQAVAMDDRELEDALERLNDLRSGGEGFENYIIIR